MRLERTREPPVRFPQQREHRIRWRRQQGVGTSTAVRCKTLVIDDQPVTSEREHERRPIETLEPLDPADQDQVIARLMHRFATALETRGDIGQQRSAAVPWPPPDAGEFLSPGPGESVRDVDLLGGQHIDGEVTCCEEDRQALGGASNRPENQRGVERDRRERVGGQAASTALRARSDDRHAGCEMAERAPERPRVGGGIALFDR